MKHLKVLLKWNWWRNLGLQNFPNWTLKLIFSRIPMGNCFWCYFRQLFISLAFRKPKKDRTILKVILIQDSCPLKTEIARFPIGFRLNFLVPDTYQKVHHKFVEEDNSNTSNSHLEFHINSFHVPKVSTRSYFIEDNNLWKINIR